MTSTARIGERWYSLFGLEIDSDFELPELFEARPRRRADVAIRRGQIAAAAALGAGVHEVEGGVLLIVQGCARYLVSNGCEIIVEPEAGASSKNIRLYLLGSAFGLLLHQRKLLPLHANSIEVEDGAVSFMGPSGIGKSTLASWFHDRGFRLIADDVSVIDFDAAGFPVVCPGFPRLRLWEEVLLATGRDPKDFNLSFEGDAAYTKRDVAISPDRIAGTKVPLRAAVLLEEGRSDLQLLSGAEAVGALFSNTYRGAFVELADTVRDHWIACTTLALTIPIYRVGLRGGLAELDGSCERLINQLRAELRSRPS